MLTDVQIRALESAWTPARAAGALGGASIEALVDHAAGYIPAAFVVRGEGAAGAGRGEVSADGRGAVRADAVIDAIDIGTGVGVPGVLLALLLPRSRWRLLDASEARCRLAWSAVSAVGLGDRVEVVHGRADVVAHDSRWRGSADLVVARLFGPPAEVAECGVPLLSPTGRLVVSTSDTAIVDWQRLDLRALGAVVERDWTTDAGRYLEVRRRGSIDDRFPRRAARRRRDPLS